MVSGHSSGYFFGLRSALVILSASAVLMACGRPAASTSSTSANSMEVPAGLEIIGGQTINPGDAMSHGIVALYDTQLHALCTASIVSPKYLITAAHCVRPGQTANLRVVYGTDMTNKATIIAVGQVAGALQSPLWASSQNKAMNSGDIALVRLASPLPAGYQAVPILTDATVLRAGAAVLLQGYGVSVGRPDPKSTNDNGAGVLRQVITTLLNPSYSQSEVMIDESQGKGACHGDSGGPAFVNVGGKAMLFGVTSRGTDQFCGKGVVYTNILAYMKWLPTAVQQLESRVQQMSGVMMPHLIASEF